MILKVSQGVRRPSTAEVASPTYLVAIMHSRHDLPEEVSGLPLAEASPLTDVIIQLSFAGIFHDDHNLIFVLKHCGGGQGNKQTLLPSRVNYDSRDGARTTTMEMSLSQTGLGEGAGVTNLCIQHWKDLGQW